VGIAVTGVNGTPNGSWEYSTNSGANWTLLNAVPQAALLLSSSDMLRFVPLPSASFVGIVTLQGHAWDGTSGAHGGTANLVGAGKTGGATAFSANTLTATLRVNSAPVLGQSSLPNLPSINEDAGSSGPVSINTMLTEAS